MEEKTISSQVFTKNNKFEILEKISEKEDGKYKYYTRLRCITCNEIKIVQASHKERTICQNCKNSQKTNEIIGNEFGTYKVLSFHHTENWIRFYNVKCTYCGIESIQSVNHLKNNPKSCSSCKYERRNSIPTLQAPRNCVKSTYISGAKARDLEFSLSDEDFDNLIFNNCYYCDSKPSVYQSDLKFNKTDEVFKRNGIDRLDSTFGYTKENCVPCCPTCNLMKMTLSHNEFLSHINKIHSNIVNKGSTTISKESTLQAKGNGNGEHPTFEDDDIV